jgi:hypothetical protein
MKQNIINNYNNLILSKKIVIVYFHNYECEKTNNIFDYFKKNKNNNVLLINYDVENINNTELITHLDLKCFPFFYVYKNGFLIDQILGTLNIEKIISQYLST